MSSVEYAREHYGELGVMAFELAQADRGDRIITNDGEPVRFDWWMEPLWVLSALTAEECDRLAALKRAEGAA